MLKNTSKKVTVENRCNHNFLFCHKHLQLCCRALGAQYNKPQVAFCSQYHVLYCGNKCFNKLINVSIINVDGTWWFHQLMEPSGSINSGTTRKDRRRPDGLALSSWHGGQPHVWDVP